MSTFDATEFTAGGTHHFEEDEEYGEPGPPAKEPLRWHAGADLGLLALRLMLAGIVGVHGAQRLFGVLGGKGIEDFAKSLQTAGFKQSGTLAYALAGTELGGAALLVLGLLTPLAAAAVLAVVGNTVVLDWNGGLSAYELAAMLGASAFALLFAGPGRMALDRPLPWFRRPLGFGTVFLLLAVSAVAALHFLLR
ncbi:DoxX family membrane protein [Kutzneria albida]|uniref:DoxX family protein n=1 Tax=Kutzneria albida DSM 43870 TaxID=1449976 RepID=W5WHV8_9PSEU|nr:DoxX family membrane protein [Kutzneria albida]AHI00784.1 hypothetical protein KALB_7426 [Kutzneria albida DSM 43870]